jgi:hypothetical protein
VYIRVYKSFTSAENPGNSLFLAEFSVLCEKNKQNKRGAVPKFMQKAGSRSWQSYLRSDPDPGTRLRALVLLQN